MSGGFGCYTDGSTQALDCAVQGLFAGVGGQAIFALLVSGVLAVGFYTATNGGIAVPAVILTLMGGFMVVLIPPQYQSTAQILIFVGMVAALLALANRYVLEV